MVRRGVKFGVRVNVGRTLGFGFMLDTQLQGGSYRPRDHSRLEVTGLGFRVGNFRFSCLGVWCVYFTDCCYAAEGKQGYR